MRLTTSNPGRTLVATALCSCVIFTYCCVGTLRAEQAAPPPTPTPAPTPAPGPTPVPAPPAPAVAAPIDWTPLLADIQSSDKAKQESASKFFLDAGHPGYNMLATLLKNPDADVVKRVRDLRNKIDDRTYKLFQEAMGKRDKVYAKPLEPEALDELRTVWEGVGAYASIPAVRQQAFTLANEVRRASAAAMAAKKQLTEIEKQMAGDPPPAGLAKAALMLARAEASKALLRDKDVLIAAQEAEQASGPKGRLTPAALKVQAEACQRLSDYESVRAISRRIIADFPRSMETHYAHQAILDSLGQERRYDDAIRELKEYFAAFPVDDDVQQSITGLMQTLMDTEHDYKHVAELAEWAMSALPMERIDSEVPKCYAGCNEYFVKDFVKAERGYSMLHEYYSDALDPKDVEQVLERVRLKAAGKFFKEPGPTAEGPAGALGAFLLAVRSKDAKALTALIPAADADAFKAQLEQAGDSIVPLLTFCDVIVENIEYSPTKESATLFLNVYPSAGRTAKPVMEFASKENDVWKIRWRNPQEGPGALGEQGPAAEGNGINLLPPPAPAPIPGPVAPSQPQPQKQDK